VTINVTPPGAPVAAATSGSGPDGTTITAAGSATGSGPFTYALGPIPPAVAADGTASIVDGTGVISFDPINNFSGPVPTFTYTATDVYNQTSAPANVSITVTPVANDDSYGVVGGQMLTEAAPGVLGNDMGSGLTVTAHTTPAHGTLTINADGSFSYVPTVGFSGADTFTYSDSDSSSQTSNTATVTITVSRPAPPTAVNTGGITPADTGLTFTPPTPSGTGPFTYTLSTTPPAADGTATLNPTTGLITFDPAPGFSGTVPTFTYTVTDPYGDVSAAADVDIIVDPVAAPTTASGVEGTTVTVTVPTPVGVGPFTYTLIPGSLPPASIGTVTINPTTGVVTFHPAAGFVGDVPVQYVVTGPSGNVSAPATVLLEIDPAAVPVPTTGAFGEGTALGGLALIALGLGLLTAAVVTRRRFGNLPG